jgi:hypothetical protein
MGRCVSTLVCWQASAQARRGVGGRVIASWSLLLQLLLLPLCYCCRCLGVLGQGMMRASMQADGQTGGHVSMQASGQAAETGRQADVQGTTEGRETGGHANAQRGRAVRQAGG